MIRGFYVRLIGRRATRINYLALPSVAMPLFTLQLSSQPVSSDEMKRLFRQPKSSTFGLSRHRG